MINIVINYFNEPPPFFLRPSEQRQGGEAEESGGGVLSKTGPLQDAIRLCNSQHHECY